MQNVMVRHRDYGAGLAKYPVIVRCRIEKETTVALTPPAAEFEKRRGTTPLQACRSLRRSGLLAAVGQSLSGALRPFAPGDIRFDEPCVNRLQKRVYCNALQAGL